jgi:hypothetical protein
LPQPSLEVLEKGDKATMKRPEEGDLLPHVRNGFFLVGAGRIKLPTFTVSIANPYFPLCSLTYLDVTVLLDRIRLFE